MLLSISAVHTLEWLGFTIRTGSTLTLLYFDLYLNTAYAAHYVYYTMVDRVALSEEASLKPKEFQC